MLKKAKLKLLERIRKELSGTIILVEGVHDVHALKRIGIDAKIIAIGGRRLSFDSEEFNGKEVVILTDFDRRGIELKNKVIDAVRCRAGKINTRTRALFRALGIKKIEEIPKILTSEVIV